MKTILNFKTKCSFIVLNVCLIVVAVFFQSCEKPVPDLKDQFLSHSISTYDSIASRTDLSEFAQMLKIAGYKGLLSKVSNSKSTLFVPTNDAIKSYLQANYSKSSVSEFGATAADSLIIKNIVNSHLVNGVIIFMDSLKLVSGMLDYTTMNGEPLVAVYGVGGINNLKINGKCKVLSYDIQCLNGYFNVIDKVISQNDLSTLGKTIEMDTTKSIFLKLLQLTNYYDTINTITYKSNKPVRYTVFVSSNSYFRERGFSIDKLMGMSKRTLNNPANVGDSLNIFVSGHIVRNQYFVEDLNSELSTLNEQTMRFDTSGVGMLVNKSLGNTNPDVYVDLLRNNVVCSNGLIHELKGVIEMKEAPASRVIWAFNEHFTSQSWYSENDYTTGHNITDTALAWYNPLFRCTPGTNIKSVRQAAQARHKGLAFRAISNNNYSSWWEYDIVNKPIKANTIDQYSVWIHCSQHGSSAPIRAEFNVYWNGVKFTDNFSNPMKVGNNLNLNSTLYPNDWDYGSDGVIPNLKDVSLFRCKVGVVGGLTGSKKIKKGKNTIRFQQVYGQYSLIYAIEFVPVK